eukprot:TRINITY_DN66173_c0_g1_i1.p1 TRINITY_DN66173_c0_g1~~TRINITY_DN66173_c0_g1_i1.p1  ORF type:complete len:304 (+),score=70.85 TRINITY_DN66173_c0_g1_i1:1346-2257(+)
MLLSLLLEFVPKIRFFEGEVFFKTFSKLQELDISLRSSQDVAKRAQSVVEKFGSGTATSADSQELVGLHGELTRCKDIQIVLPTSILCQQVEIASAFWNAAAAKWKDVLKDHTEGQFQEGGMWDALQYFDPSVLNASVDKKRVRDLLEEHFAVIKHDPCVKDEFSKYMACYGNMIQDDVIKAWTSPPATTVLPNLSDIVRQMMCFIPSTAAVERSFSIMKHNSAPSRSNLSASRLGALDILRCNQDYISRTQLGDVPSAVFRTDVRPDDHFHLEDSPPSSTSSQSITLTRKRGWRQYMLNYCD